VLSRLVCAAWKCPKFAEQLLRMLWPGALPASAGLECLHPGLPPVMQVRSLTLDVKVWEPSVVALFQQLGNTFANSVWEVSPSTCGRSFERLGSVGSMACKAGSFSLACRRRTELV
jgi:hypothetical protein